VAARSQESPKVSPLALLYHDVVSPGNFESSGFVTAGANHYKLTTLEFDEHLRCISSAVRSKPVRITDNDWRESFLFTIDDGGAGSMLIADRLESLGWRGHFFITTDQIGKTGFLKSNEIRNLSERGHVIGSHSCSHPLSMWTCTDDFLFKEWSGSRRVLEDILGNDIVSASVPGGFYSRRIASEAARAGLRILFNSEPTRTVGEVDGCRIIGRFGITRSTSPAKAGRLACGDRLTCVTQYTAWNAKKFLKRVAAKPYAALRARLLKG
jgi:peptidoglycan/xylan/chitin deacetylase (PgdA/CDA1 family)